MTEFKNQLQLVSAIESNNEAVLKKLYQGNYPRVEAYILKNSGTMPQAKDIYQEAFLAVWQNIKKGAFQPQNESALQGYLFQIAKNKWTDFLRSASFKKTVHTDDFFSLTEETSGIEEATIKEAQLQQAMKAFTKLGKECKQLLSAFYFQHQSLREIAETFKIGEASARNKKYRCMQQLKEWANQEQ